MADPAQLDAFVSELLAEGLLDEQFSQLMQLQDDTNPHFVAEVRIPHYSCRAGSGFRAGNHRLGDRSIARLTHCDAAPGRRQGANLAIMYRAVIRIMHAILLICSSLERLRTSAQQHECSGRCHGTLIACICYCTRGTARML